MKNVLITGGLGFLGSYSIELWKKNNWQVTLIDNLSTNVIFDGLKHTRNHWKYKYLGHFRLSRTKIERISSRPDLQTCSK